MTHFTNSHNTVPPPRGCIRLHCRQHCSPDACSTAHFHCHLYVNMHDNNCETHGCILNACQLVLVSSYCLNYMKLKLSAKLWTLNGNVGGVSQLLLKDLPKMRVDSN